MASEGPRERAARVNDLLWTHAIAQAEQDLPEYRFYRPDAVPANLVDVCERPSSRFPDLPAVHVSYLTWPDRQRPAQPVSPLTGDEVAARCDGLRVICSETSETLNDLVVRQRSVTVTKADVTIRHGWDVAVDERRRFEKPWPAPLGAVLEDLARRCVTIDDGCSEQQWRERLDPEMRAHAETIDAMDLGLQGAMFRSARRDAWTLHRILGADLYEALTAQWRHQPAAEPVDVDQDHERLRTLGVRLRTMRTSANLTVEDVAALTGVPKTRVRDAERGGRTLKVTDLLALARLYEVSPVGLLEQDDPAKLDG